ncbi:MAG: LCP family protein, partial [Clostridia bacterium]|nr:LCP family protein [Clostridia bacterium]
LLVGLDSADALENGGRSDTLILLSLNKKTKKINMTSFFRDTWTYINVRGRDTYGKINSSYFFGGPETLIETIQNDFKIKIDYYVAVDFSSFTDIINALGGLTIEVEQYEADYINRTTVHNIEAGPAVKLDGWEALVYARIRKSDSDSDVSRTRRQRKVIMALMESAKGAGVAQLNSALDMLFKYVKTDLTRMEILSYGVQGLTNGWLNYEVQQTTIADDDVFKTGYVGSASVVFIDFELAAQRIQTAIYGDSNITLADDRVIPFRLVSRIS